MKYQSTTDVLSPLCPNAQDVSSSAVLSKAAAAASEEAKTKKMCIPEAKAERSYVIEDTAEKSRNNDSAGALCRSTEMSEIKWFPIKHVVQTMPLYDAHEKFDEAYWDFVTKQHGITL